MEMENSFKDWCIEQHRNTNHKYGENLPYEFHLQMVVKNCNKFLHLLPDENLKEVCLSAAWGHDTIEDCRVTFNDVLEASGNYGVADVIFALTNEKGKNREERANDKYYEGIRNTKGAVFVKLCDRIANVEFSKMINSRMFDMYKKENSNFVSKLGFAPDHELLEMFNYLDNLFKD